MNLHSVCLFICYIFEKFVFNPSRLFGMTKIEVLYVVVEILPVPSIYTSHAHLADGQSNPEHTTCIYFIKIYKLYILSGIYIWSIHVCLSKFAFLFVSEIVHLRCCCPTTQFVKRRHLIHRRICALNTLPPVLINSWICFVFITSPSSSSFNRY